MQTFDKWVDVPLELHNKPRLDNGLSVIVFDNQTEFETYITTNKQWNKEAYCNEVNEAHNALFRELYTQRDYLAIGEIPIWQNDAEFGEESKALQQWWIDTCKSVSDYLKSVTEETVQPIETFINSLPKFNH